MDDVAVYLDRAIRAAGVPIAGVAIPNVSDKSTWRVDFEPSATSAQRTQAASIVAAFVPPTLAQLADEDADAQTQNKQLKAVAIGLWECIPAPTMTKVQLAARIKAIYKALP